MFRTLTSYAHIEEIAKKLMREVIVTFRTMTGDLPPATDELTWLRRFEARSGRKLRVLHVGNIANNAYLAAKFLRRVGVDADVMCNDYYHIMATPEWEELEIKRDWHDDYRPRFSSEDIGDYKRPRWFAQGPVKLCALYLKARHRGDTQATETLWNSLEAMQADRLTADELRELTAAFDYDQVAHRSVKRGLRPIAAWALKLPHEFAKRVYRTIVATLMVSGFEKAAAELARIVANRRRKLDFPSYMPRFESLIDEFSRIFPSRRDKLVMADLTPFVPLVDICEPLFACYDIVQGYALDPILPLICGKRPYTTFEHGTLRVFLREDHFVHRVTSLAYRKADHVFITNGDCVEHARWLGIKEGNMSGTLHPTDVDQHEARNDAAIAALRSHYGADVLLFCPLRHDWEIKGTDVHIRALPHILQRIPRRVILLLSPWGLQIEDSRTLIEELRCQREVVWLERPLCRLSLVRHLQAADVVLDQMALPCFGGTAPQALAAGTPVVMSYRPESTNSIVSEPAPILSAFTPNDVANAVVTALDPAWRSNFKVRARSWTYTQHHHDRVVSDHLKAYRRILEGG